MRRKQNKKQDPKEARRRKELLLLTPQRYQSNFRQVTKAKKKLLFLSAAKPNKMRPQ
jgi:hypothetical protein